ncbi:MAG: thioredoxin domain-containing protein [Solirubrobacterales bacterium]
MSSRREEKERARLEREGRERELAAAAARGRRLKIISGVFGLAALAVIILVAVSLGGGGGDGVTGAEAVQARFDGIPQSDFRLGKEDAPVTIVEFADLKCPFCRDFAVAVLPTLVDDYVRDGKLRIDFRNLAFVGEAVAPGDSADAATFAAATGFQSRFWNFIDLFYANQRDESSRYATDDWLRKLGELVPGLDVEKAFAEREDARVTAQLTAADELFQEHGFSGTPSFLIGKTGGKLEKLEPESVDDVAPFTAAIDKLLK